MQALLLQPHAAAVQIALCPTYATHPKPAGAGLMQFAWKGQTFPTFPGNQIDALAPECPVVYGLVTPENEIYVGASRTPKARLRAHLASSSYSDWLKRLVERAKPTPDGWERISSRWCWTSEEDFKKLCGVMQSMTRWCVLQVFDDDCYAEDIGIAEKAWIKALEASLNSQESKGTYYNGESRGLGTQEIANAVEELIPVLPTMKPWQPQSPAFDPSMLVGEMKTAGLTVVDKPKPQGDRYFELSETDVDALNSVFEFAYFCLDMKRELVPEVSRIGADIEKVELVLAGIDKEVASRKRHRERGFDAFWREVA
ncbi:GIY-YIG nuclease family protein [Synechococcus sp. MEDNS5]|uniref:GIY-YIG nuclease family protein n=1 Tax=Synechococcus sp. MEDNS5 TaxID=1442554 RepID=UPI0016464146|nr:GIY-YIG nuclease family protein [Synechococcus sp. MEDNS5]